MKKTLFLFTILLAPLSVFAANANKMTMVTYFPVKYVAYSQVDVMKQMDIGLTSACQMNLGCSADEGFNTGKSLRVNNLLKIAGGKLELNDAPAIEGSTARIGSENGTADFDFETSLRVGNYKQGYTLQADNMYLNELNLFGYKFPKCEGETMSWQKLKLKNKEEVYLVCGEAEQGACEPPADEPTEKPCDYGTGTQTRTWNYNTCQWNDWNKLNCKLTPTEDTYVWTLTDSGYGWAPQGARCGATCLINSLQDPPSGHPFLLPDGSLVTTTTALIPECTSSNVGKTCKVGGIKAKTLEESDRYYYCPTYTCTKK